MLSLDAQKTYFRGLEPNQIMECRYFFELDKKTKRRFKSQKNCGFTLYSITLTLTEIQNNINLIYRTRKEKRLLLSEGINNKKTPTSDFLKYKLNN